MPKPRTVAREQRRAARALAVNLVASYIADLSADPPTAVPSEALAAFRDQLAHLMPRTRTRTHRPTRSAGDGAKIIAGLRDAIEMARRENGA